MLHDKKNLLNFTKDQVAPINVQQYIEKFYIR